MGYLYYSQENEIEELTAKQKRIQQEVDRYAKFEQLLKTLSKEKDLIEKKKTVITNLQKDRDAVIRVLTLLSIQVPKDKMWFGKLSQVNDTITLEGTAMSDEAIVEFMRNLESSPYVAKNSVSLTHSRQKEIKEYAGGKLRDFQIIYRFLPYSEVKKNLKANPS